jgi:hypothetical protein
LAVVVLGGSLAFGWSAAAEKRADRPDAGVPLVEAPSPVPVAPAASGSESRPGTPAPRALDSARTPMPDRDALPKDLQDARLAPPTPPVPQSSGTKTGGGPNRVKDIFHGQNGAAGRQQTPGAVTGTPEDQTAPAR